MQSARGESDAIEQIELLKLIIKEKSFIHQRLLDYFGISCENGHETKDEAKIDDLYLIFKEKLVLTNKCEFKDLLSTIFHIWEMHHLKEEIRLRIENIFSVLKNDIKNIFSETEFFDIYKNTKSFFILLIFVDQNILSIETIITNLDFENYFHREIIINFYPDIKKHSNSYFYDISEKGQKFWFNKLVEENEPNPDLFIQKRKEYVKEPKIIELIREDKIEEFISFVEHSPIDLNEKIPLIKILFDECPMNLTPIEYSAFFGSITIFKYLFLKNVRIIVKDENNDIIKCAIHGRNYEIIHLLEDKLVMKELSKHKIKKYLQFSIKMHHNEVFEYFISNYYDQAPKKYINSVITFRNIQLFNQLIERNKIDFKDEAMITKIFFAFCRYGNGEIVKILLNQPNLDINSRDEIFLSFI